MTDLEVSAGFVTPRQLVDGAWSDAGGETAKTAIGQAVRAAWREHRAHPLGIGTREQRIHALHAAADLLDECADEIAVQDALDSGVPISVTRLFAQSLGSTLRGAADRITGLQFDDLSANGRDVRLHRLPLGPVAVLAPWNAPTAVAAKKVAYAWAAGCPVIVKPSPWSPHGTTVLVESLGHAAAGAGLAPASVQLVFGGAAAGQALAGAPQVRAISFTGSRAGGRAVAATAAAHLAALQLELGSNNPAVVLDDADIESTAAALAAGMTKLNGAWCESPGTVFVSPAHREVLVLALIERLRQHVFGDPLDARTTFGPQANQVQADTLRARMRELEDAGATVVPVGSIPSGDRWIAPTLVVDPPADLARDEFFGPILLIRTVSSATEAINESYELATGLAGYVFTRDIAEGHRVGPLLPVGEVKINGTSLLDMSDRSAQGFWYGSGIGGHGDAELLDFFTGARIVGQDVASPI